jgi:hypothetical protein
MPPFIIPYNKIHFDSAFRNLKIKMWIADRSCQLEKQDTSSPKAGLEAH